jgi:hypothetical protein
MKGISVHMCDLGVVMKVNRTSDFGVGSPYSLLPSISGNNTLINIMQWFSYSFMK